MRTQKHAGERRQTVRRVAVIAAQNPGGLASTSTPDAVGPNSCREAIRAMVRACRDDCQRTHGKGRGRRDCLRECESLRRRGLTSCQQHRYSR